MAKERPVKGVDDGLEEDGKQDKHSHCDECNQYFVLKDPGRHVKSEHKKNSVFL